MRTVFLSAGHSNKRGRDMGAVSSWGIEGELTVELRNLLVRELSKLGVKVIVDSDNSVLSETLTFFRNKTTNDCIVIDLHWNAASPQATGTEVLVPTNPTKFERDLATKLAQTLSETLGIRNRGVKTEADSHHGRLGWMRLTGENILIETCFISNKTDMDKYQANKEQLAKNLAKDILNFAKNNTTPTQENIYIVKSGDTLSKIATQNKTTVEKIKKDNSLTSDLIKVGQKLKI
jgi:N-acetylmuramoyl-L-alanine amidase